MSFSDHKITQFTHKIADLPDQPNMPADELKKRMMDVRYRMYAAGAHYVVDSIEELPALIEAINTRMNNE